MSRVPDSIDPVVGWRTWQPTLVAMAGGLEWRLKSPFVCTAWVPRAPMRAECDTCVTPPTRGCGCGIYAFSAGPFVEDVPGQVMVTESLSVIGQVAGWGRVVKHVKGWRAAVAYPRSLAIICSDCSASDSGYVPATWVDVGERGELSTNRHPLTQWLGQRSSRPCRTACHAHAGGVLSGVKRFLAAEVEAELCARYGVFKAPRLHGRQSETSS